MNPYPKTIIDESSGEEVINDRWSDYQDGVNSVIKWIQSHDLIKPDDRSLTRFSPYYHIERKELIEVLS
jgi:hypothetical protein